MAAMTLPTILTLTCGVLSAIDRRIIVGIAMTHEAGDHAQTLGAALILRFVPA
jgi:hypothetical protein